MSQVVIQAGGERVVLDYTVTTPAPPPAPQPPRILWGSSMGGGGVKNVTDTLALWPGMDVARIYEPGMGGPTPWSQSQCRFLPSGTAVVYSFKAPASDVLAGKYDAAYLACYNSVPASCPDFTLVFWHEPSNNDPINASDFVACNEHLVGLIKKRKPNVFTGIIHVGYMIQTGSPDAWYPPSVDRLGFDTYHSPASKACVAYAKAKKKPYVIGEFGKSDPSPADLGPVQDIVAEWKDYPPVAACYFNSSVGGTFGLTFHPSVLAWLKKQQ